MDINKVREFAGRVISVSYPRSETPDEEAVMSWRVLYVDAGDLGHISASGKIGWRPKPREELRFWGKFELYRGKPTFRFTRAAYEIPANERGMLHQACMMATGVGEATEEAIWQAKGDDWREVTRDDVRISESALANLHQAIEDLKLNGARAEAVAFLLDCGCTDAMAAAAFERWKTNTISKVHADPYCLCSLHHYGFREIDNRIAPRFGMTRSDHRRITAAIRYAFDQLTDSATVVYWQVLCDEILKAVPNAEHAAIERAVQALVASGAIKTFKAETADNPKLTTRRLYTAEQSIVDYAVTSLAATDNTDPHLNLTNMDVALDDSQLRAIMAACERRFLIINGGAGSGKTTIIRAIADTLGATNVEICAFAGKAAARLRERTGHNARTIHSMLQYKGDTLGFKRPDLNGKTVILDEASMVNSELLAEITKRTPARLIMVGDEAQLPPVGAGSPFHDLIRLMPDTVCTLTTCYRNSEAIYKAALAVRNSTMPLLKDKTESEFWQFASTGTPEATHSQILKLVRDKQIDFATDLVLACRNGDGLNMRAAVDSLNVDIKAIVNPPRRDDNRAPLRQLDECDRVICTQNDPETDTWNGTTGTINSIDLSGGAYIGLDYPTTGGEDEVYIEKSKLKNWSLAYALTVHKSQGSQYRRVFFVCLMRDTFMLLDRSMLYTAMTRATEACYGLGQLQAFKTAIGKADRKLTCIQELLS